MCRCDSDWRPSSAETIEAIKADIRARVGPTNSVLFFVSGGVDSTVAYKLCAEALGQDRVHGVYVDTGFMRKNESADVMAAYENAGFKNVRLRDASAEFLAAVGTRDESGDQAQQHRRGVPRRRERVLEHLPDGRLATRAGHDLSRHDRIGRHARIGAHQDASQPRAGIAAADRGGRIVEPLVQFYKDEVREIGRALGLSCAFDREAAVSRARDWPSVSCAPTRPAAWSENSKLSRSCVGIQPEGARASGARRGRAGR